MNDDWNGMINTTGRQGHYTPDHPIPPSNAYGCGEVATSYIDLRQTDFIVDPNTFWPSVYIIPLHTYVIM
jgi:hypothetical protein